MSLKSFSLAYSDSNYHIVLVTKDRGDIFKNIHVARVCKIVFQDIANQYGYRILALDVMEDHVHLFLEIHLTHSLSGTFQLFKRISHKNYFGDLQV